MHSSVKMVCVAVMAAVMSVSTLPLASAESLATRHLIEDGIKELEKGNRERAVSQFRKVILLDPGNGEAIGHLDRLGASPDYYSDSPYKKFAVKQRANQALEEYQQKVAQLNQEVNRMLFRLERAQYDYLHEDRASYLYHGEYMEIEDTEDSGDSAAVSVEAENDQLSQAIRDLDAVEAMLGRVEELPEIELVMDDQPSVADAAESPADDRVMDIIDDYLDVREVELENARNDLVAAQVELSSTQQALADQIDATDQLNDVYAQVMRQGDGYAYYILQENSYMDYLEGKLDDSQDRLLETNTLSKNQAVLLACLQEELEQSRRDVSRLIEERDEMLDYVVHEVNIMREKDKPR